MISLLFLRGSYWDYFCKADAISCFAGLWNQEEMTGDTLSDKELAFVFTKKANGAFVTTPDIVYSNKFDKIMCDFYIKKFLVNDIGVMSFKNINREEK